MRAAHGGQDGRASERQPRRGGNRRGAALRPIDVYSRDILFHFGDVPSFKKAVRRCHTQEQTDAIFAELDFDNNSKGKTIYSSVHNAFIVWMPSLPQSSYDMQFLSHEIFHAAHALMIGVGINLSDDSEEAYAYLIGYITKRVLEEFPICSFVGCRDAVSEQKQQPS